jgi:hypothetical protein
VSCGFKFSTAEFVIDAHRIHGRGDLVLVSRRDLARLSGQLRMLLELPTVTPTRGKKARAKLDEPKDL